MDDIKNSAIRVTKILLRAQDDPAVLLELEQFRRSLVVMFTDIQGSTAYFEKHGDAAGLFMVRKYNDVIRSFVQQYGGTLIKTIGDGSMAMFPEIDGAVHVMSRRPLRVGELCTVKIERADAYDLYGAVVGY